MTPSPLWKTIQTMMGISADGIPGNITLNTLLDQPEFQDIRERSWPGVQKKLNVTSDGIPGPLTARATLILLQVRPWNKKQVLWPLESEAEKYFGKPGDGLEIIELPYPMRLSWDKNTIVNRMTCHSLVAMPLFRIFYQTLEHYGQDKISELGLDLFGGCYNNRDKVGGSTKSMHAYGIAVDLDPDRNQLKWGKDKAVFAKPEYEPFWQIVEAENAVSLGRSRNYDWMHFQFARLN